MKNNLFIIPTQERGVMSIQRKIYIFVHIGYRYKLVKIYRHIGYWQKSNIVHPYQCDNTNLFFVVLIEKL